MANTDANRLVRNIKYGKTGSESISLLKKILRDKVSERIRDVKGE